MTSPLTEPVYKVGTDISVWPYSKLSRAAEHLNRLQSAVGLWLADQPIGTKAQLSDDRLLWELRMVVRQSPPLNQWSTLLGDCVHNLRSALDSAIWELATMNGASPSKPNQVQFPVVTDPLKWSDAVANRLQTVPQHIAERVRITQPFNRPESDRLRDPLVLLQNLSNEDKHRASIKCRLSVDSINANFAASFADDRVASRNTPPNVTLHEPSIDDGALVVEYRTLDPIRSWDGGFGVGLELLLETPAGPQKLFDLMSGVINYIGQLLAILHGGATQGPPSDEAQRGAH